MIASGLTIAEAAHRSRLSVRTIRRALRDPRRQLGHWRVGTRIVIGEHDLFKWLELHRVPQVLNPGVLDRVSPEARNLLRGFFGGTPAAPSAA